MREPIPTPGTDRRTEPREFRLAGRLIQPHLNRIVAGDTTIQVEPKIVQVLLCLAQHSGEVVTKEELIERVWEGVFVTEDVLVRAVSELRKALEDGSGGAPRVIETIRKRGYRLLAPPVYDLAPVPVRTEPRAAARPPRPWTWTAAAAAAVVVMVAGVVWRWPAAPVQPRFTPLTSLEGNEFDPVPSPDGSRVVFAWDGGRDDGPTSLYAKVVGSETLLRLTENGNDRAPAWSPDGSRIAFVRRERDACTIAVVPALGGPAQRLLPCTNPGHSRISFTPDGAAVLATRPTQPGAVSSRLVRVPLDGSPESPLTSPADDVVDTSPVASPDGTRVAFIRELSDGIGDLYVMPLQGGTARRVTNDDVEIMGFGWFEGGRRLAFSSNRAGMFSLWAVPVGGGTPELIAGGGRKIKHPSPSRAGDALAYEAWDYEINLWHTGLGAEGAPGTSVAPATDEWTFEPRLSPDGRRVAFVSTRSGSYELWVAAADGAGLVRLTSFGGPYVGQPRWSPDGACLAFVERPEGRPRLHIVEAGGGAPRPVSSGRTDELAPSWSADGQWLYFAAREAGAWQVRKRRLYDGQERTLTRDGGYAALETADGRWLYFSRIDRPGLWRMPVEGGPTETVTRELRPEHWACWGLSDAGVYWLAPDGDAPPLIRLLSPGRPEPQTAARVPDLGWSSLDLSKDGRTLLYPRVGRHLSNLVLLSFRTLR